MEYNVKYHGNDKEDNLGEESFKTLEQAVAAATDFMEKQNQQWDHEDRHGVCYAGANIEKIYEGEIVGEYDYEGNQFFWANREYKGFTNKAIHYIRTELHKIGCTTDLDDADTDLKYYNLEALEDEIINKRGDNGYDDHVTIDSCFKFGKTETFYFTEGWKDIEIYV